MILRTWLRAHMSLALTDRWRKGTTVSQAYSPTREAFRAFAQEQQAGGTGAEPYTLVSRQIPADLETPVSALLKIRRGEHCFLLESVERGTQVGRYSFLGTGPQSIFTVKDGQSRIDTPEGRGLSAESTDPLGELDALLASRRLVVPEGLPVPRFAGGAVGYAGYETACTLEPVRPAANDLLGLPEMSFAFYDTFLVFDHAQRSARVYSLAPLSGDPDVEYAAAVERIEQLVGRLRRPLPESNGHRRHGEIAARSPVSSNFTQAEYEGIVEAAKEHIAAGDIIQVVVSQRFDRPTGADAFSIYRALRMVNPSPYMFFLQFGDTYLVGASPEMLVQVQEGKLAMHPIAGTRPRGVDMREDARLAKELASDEKERAEHVMLVDLGRNDIGRIARIGSVKVPRFMEVEQYSHVMHLVSEVTGDLRPELGAVDALRACLPAGTLSGAPKVRAMQIISELERDRRGPYGGAAGYISYNGNLDTAIIIRTIVVRDGMAHLQAGAGIVADSVPEMEYRETLAKAKVLIAAIDLAEEMESEHTALEYATVDEPAPEGASK
ncbi:MAG TPA: anthranilate synthase component I [Chloroflexia bacterium]|nr:anthranilate synthase component I [Chloroflexia bacterium]